MGRSPCCDKTGLKKGPWTPEEDQMLLDYIHKHGYGNWRTLPKNAGLQRCGKSCRLRWTNYLRPDIKRGRFSFEEEETIIQLHSILGNKWSAIAARLPGRTDNEIKNYWNTHIRKRLLKMGIDPVTHNPRLDLLASSLYNNPPHQINLPRLLGHVQPFLNPQILRLASSLFSSQHRPNMNPNYFALQNANNVQGNPMSSQLVQSSQIQTPLVQDVVPNFTSDEAQLLQHHQPNNVDQFPSNLNNFNSLLGTCQVNEWQSDGTIPSNLAEDYLTLENYDYYDPPAAGHQSIMDPPPSDASTFQSALSTLSTPSSSSPTPLSSNSTYISTTTVEDEKDISYSSNILDYFDYSSILEVNNEFM